MWSYESRAHPPVSLHRFVLRTLAHFAVSVVLMAMSVVAGLAGFMHYERMPWRDAFMETAMLLGGMGPTWTPTTNGGKIFAALFALYAGLVFVVAGAILVSPVVHRMLHLHLFHRDGDREADSDMA